MQENPELTYIRDEKEATRAYSRIIAAPIDVFQFRAADSNPDGRGFESALGKPRVIFEKTKTSFRKPETMPVTETYIFGPAFTLQDITIGNTVVPIRPAPASALVWLGKVGMGSCPFLFTDDGMGDPSLIGRILIGASAPGLARFEEIWLPPGTKAVLIAEQEPEVTYLTRVAVKMATGEHQIVLGEDIEIRPRRFHKFELPAQFVIGSAILIVQGHYKQLGISEQPTR
jgi:hypothetical protein